jgi:hypothetical protein
MATAETEEEAVGRGVAAIRAQLGWETDSETRAETLGARWGCLSKAIIRLAN